MNPSTRQCPSCTTPLPGDAVFCPRCGHATPTEISLGTGEARQVPSVEVAETEYRARLGRALGSGYELRELLGRGGFGAVYVAWEVRLEREVAVKALRPDLFASSQLLERFEREAKAAAKLRHPNILPVYAVGEGEGLAYMVMPRVRGESLRDLLDREETLSVEETRRIVAEVAAGLGAAHEAGVVHRDIKPDNIMLEGPERRVLVMDFGIAKAMGAGETGLTATGMIVGTPQYMSPEQATGEREIGPAADLYSLGIVAFQMLTGRLPFEANTIEQLIVARITMDAPDLRSLRSDVPADLAAAVARCLARNPRNRWPSAAALAIAVAPVSGGQNATRPRSRRSWRRRPVVVAAAGVCVLAAVAFLGYRVVVSRSAPLEGECLNLVARHYVALRTSQCDTASFEVAQVLSGDSIRSALLRAVTGSNSSLSAESFTLVPPSARRNAAEAAEVYDIRVASGNSEVGATISIAVERSIYLRRLSIVTFSTVPGWAPRLAEGLARELAGSGLSSLDRASIDVDSICTVLRRFTEGSEARGTCGTRELVNDDPFRRSDVPNAIDAVVQATSRLGLRVMEMYPLPMSDDSVVNLRWRFTRGTDSTAAGWLRGVELGIPRRVVVAVASDTRSQARRILNTIDSAMTGEGRPLRRVALKR